MQVPLLQGGQGAGKSGCTDSVCRAWKSGGCVRVLCCGNDMGVRDAIPQTRLEPRRAPKSKTRNRPPARSSRIP